MASNVAVLFTTGSLKHSLRKFWPLYVATLPGILFGVFLLTWVDKRIPTQVLGVIICAYAILALLSARLDDFPQDSENGASSGRSFEWGVDGLHGLAGDALDALHACPQPGARAFCSGGKHRCRGRISFLGYRSMDSGPDVGAGFQLVRSGNRAGVAWGPTWKLGETAYPSVAVQVHRARGPASDRASRSRFEREPNKPNLVTRTYTFTGLRPARRMLVFTLEPHSKHSYNPVTSKTAGCSQAVRQRILIPPCPGSNPGTPAN